MNPYAVTITPEQQDLAKPIPFGGWLILVGIGVVISPLRLLMFLASTYPPIFTDGTWIEVAHPEGGSYIPYWGPLLISELAVNAIVVAGSFYLIYAYFRKLSSFPHWYAGLSVFSLFFIVVDAYLVSVIVPGIEMFDQETMKEIFRVLVSLLIWTPYLFISQRSKETFVCR